jgi:hypothetical protein
VIPEEVEMKGKHKGKIIKKSEIIQENALQQVKYYISYLCILYIHIYLLIYILYLFFVQHGSKYRFFSSCIPHLFSCPSYKLSTLSTIPQVSSTNKTFNTYTWNYLIKHGIQMHLAHGWMEEKINWSIRIPSVSKLNKSHIPSNRVISNEQALTMNPDSYFMSQFSNSNQTKIEPLSIPEMYDEEFNVSLSTSLYLRGSDVTTCDARIFKHPGLYASYAIDPLQVVRSNVQVNRDDKVATIWR